MIRLIKIAVLILSLIPSFLLAQGINTGLAAYEVGDYATALQEWQRLAEQGNVEAQSYLALLYHHGKGVKQDPSEAVKWFRKAADQGDSYSQHNLAVSYQRGIGIEQDIETAIVWYRRAAEQNETSSMYNLGQVYLHGGLIEATEAAHWIRQAAELNHTFAQHNLGGMYIFGNGIPQSNILGHMWFEIAFINGDNKGATSMGMAEERMSAADIDEARRRVWVCMDSDYQDCD